MRNEPYTNSRPSEYAGNPYHELMIGSVMARSASGARYACHEGRRAPAKTLVAPTGAKLGGWGSSRAIAPSTVNDNAAGRHCGLIISIIRSLREPDALVCARPPDRRRKRLLHISAESRTVGLWPADLALLRDGDLDRYRRLDLQIAGLHGGACRAGVGDAYIDRRVGDYLVRLKHATERHVQ